VAADPAAADFGLQRFVEAQDRVYSSVVGELRSGQKRSHWMWFVFPQLQGLGSSAMAREYAIRSREEARAYADHPVLGPRLRECVELVLATERRTASQIFSYPDDLKFHSSMTLFEATAAVPDVFRAALTKYFDGRPDQRTLDLLRHLKSRI
jgi:uncharacterized protein (DUF1810 family)